jgi:hypothetical protein
MGEEVVMRYRRKIEIECEEVRVRLRVGGR